MAIVESSPEPGACPRRGAMGSVGSLLAGRPCHDRPGQAAGFVPARPAPPGPGPWGSQDPLLLSLRPKKSPASPCSDAEEPRGGSLRGPPPKLVPISGRLEKNVEKTLIRPTAFKPVVPKGRSPGGPALSDSQASLAQLFEKPGGPHSCRHSAHSGTLSDSGRNSLSSLPTYSTGGSHAEPPGATLGHGVPDGLGARGLPGPWASDSGRSSSSKSSGSLSGRGAPSSDGGSHGRSPGSGDEALLVRELEEKLREREAELRWLRESLEDEGAGGQVLGEPVAGGAAELVARQAGRGRRAQQVLQLQVLQLTQEKRQLQDDFAQLLQERELLETRCAALERQQAQLGPRLEETQWEVCQKAGEISLLKQQLKEAAGEAAQRGAELLGLRAQLREARAGLQAGEAGARELREAVRAKALELERCGQELGRRQAEAECLRLQAGRLERELAALRGTEPALGPEAPESLRRRAERLRAELEAERRRGREERQAFEAERCTWQAEKDEVLRYQRRLQQHYVHMYRRNRQLERRLGPAGPGPGPGPGPALRLEEIAATQI